MGIPARERAVVRDLATQVKDLAAQPVMVERRDLWRRHNRLDKVRPMVLIFPEGSWREIHPESSLVCEHPAARAFEDDLRWRLLYPTVLGDDTVIEAVWTVRKAISDTGWGLERQWKPSAAEKGAGAYDGVIKTADDLHKLRFPEVMHDEAETERRIAEAQDLVGDILEVQVKSVAHISFHLMAIYCYLRGLEQVMLDMCENPNMLHDAMAFLEEGHRRLVRQYEDMNLFSLNNDGTYHSSGGVGYTDELPKPDFVPGRVRPCDMWASAEAQELASVSPEMHEEFSFQYERRLLEPFGLTGYGCCEDLTLKLDMALSLPTMRRVSISPFVQDLGRCAERLGDRCIFSWKPHPSHLVGGFDAGFVRNYLRRALEATRGCVFEMILKDTHTCENHPERFTQWGRIARELVEEFS